MAWASEAAKPQPTIAETIKRDQAILTWRNLRDELARVKEAELAARNALDTILFPVAAAGTQRYDLGGGYFIKKVGKLNYKVDPETAEAAQDAIEKLGNEGAFLADRLVKWKPELSVSEYKALDPANPSHKKIKAELDKVITTSWGTPALELEEPKDK